MDRIRIALLLVGLLNLVLIGAVACGKQGPAGNDGDLTARVAQLEAWRMLQEGITDRQNDALSRQHTLNQSFDRALKAAHEHATSVDRSLEKQTQAMKLINEILQDLLKKVR
ncbi:MAG: hypothetical protein QNJ90_15355 [Planctomycetota bacterium]|nr:hypothetical protein [Planctomycetota bacterium]